MPTNFLLPNQDGQIVYKKTGISLSHLSLWTPARKASLISSIFASKYLLQTSQSFNLYKESYLKLKLLKNPRNDELIILHQQTTYWIKKKIQLRCRVLTQNKSFLYFWWQLIRVHHYFPRFKTKKSTHFIMSAWVQGTLYTPKPNLLCRILCKSTKL